jgi:hypothetical protein
VKIEIQSSFGGISRGEFLDKQTTLIRYHNPTSNAPPSEVSYPIQSAKHNRRLH